MATAHRATVLVVDDEADLREAMSRMLERSGFTTLAADSSARAVALCRAVDTRIDLLVTDLGMPDLSGAQLAELARASRPGLPVLFVSGLPREVAVAQGLIPRAAELVSKPFTAEGLLRAVRTAIVGG